MNVLELLRTMKRGGISVSSEHGKLKTIAPKGAITTDIAELIRAHKDALIEFLERVNEQAEGARARIVPQGWAASHPLSFAQQRLWFIDRLQGASPQYNIPMALQLDGALDRAALQKALSALVARHATLRTRFVEQDGVPVQIVDAPAEMSIAHEDLSRLDTQFRTDEVQRRIQSEFGRAFDLAGGPVLRCRLLRLAPESHVLLLTIHHIASDAWSIAVMMREVGLLYGAFMRGAADPLPPITVQYTDFARWQRKWLSGDALDRQLTYWRSQLSDIPGLLEFPTDRPRSNMRLHAGSQFQV